MKYEGIRIPRPYGITQAMVAYHTSGDPVILENIQGLIIQQWVINNGYIFGSHYSIQALSNFIKCTPDKIRNHMMGQLVNTQIFDKTHQQEILESLIGQQITWALEDRMDIEHQLSILRESQKGKYTPFITGEVNRVLGLKLSASSNFQSIVKNLTPGNNINIFNQQNNQTINSGVSIEEAIEIVQKENAKLLETNKEVNYIEQHYPVNELPEIVATKQTGIDTRKEGLTINRVELIQAMDTYIREDPDENHHETRREKELGVDMEDVDPEMEQY